jgi:two-component system chemotaxis sensor kinase CheA
MAPSTDVAAVVVAAASNSPSTPAVTASENVAVTPVPGVSASNKPAVSEKGKKKVASKKTTPTAVVTPEEDISPKSPDVPAAPSRAVEQRGEELADRSTVRVDVRRLDELMNQMGELVLERNRLLQMNSDIQGEEQAGPFGEEFGKMAKRINFITSELQMQVLKMRMLPVGNVFKKFPRMVRSMSRDLGKEVDLVVRGEETELDRSVVDEIGDPLIHLIRNALDHGLETPEERETTGKSRCGTLVLAAHHEGNQIIISIKDDGRGIDTERVAKKAIEKGLLTSEQLAAMGRRELLELIFLPGFSTKEQATDLSGRGVGMDVVRTNIKRLNGLIDIKSDSGEGTEFILKLPLTLAIIQSLLVEVEGEIYAIPLASVVETVRVKESEFHHVGGQEVLKRHDSVLPLLRLEELFGVPSGAGSERRYSYVVVVGAAEKRLGLVVTRLRGQQEVAIKSLGNFLGGITGIAGSTILGDGRVTLIIDPSKLIDCARRAVGIRQAA